MSDTDIGKPFLDAAAALLAAALPGVDVFTAGVTAADDDLVYPYLVLWPSAPGKTIGNLAGTVRRADLQLQMVGVGTSPDEVITVLDRAGTALVAAKPDIPGWRCGFIRDLGVQQPVAETGVVLVDGRPTFRGWKQYGMRAEPALTAGS